MRKYKYKVHIRSINVDIKFNCSTITFINRYIRKLIRDFGPCLNLVIRDYQTNIIIQDCSLHHDFTINNRIYSNLQLIKNNNLYYIENHEKNKIR